MPERISRARLIQSALATGFLTACGGGTSAPPVSPTSSPNPICVPLTSNAADRFGLSKYFEQAIFKHIDKEALFREFDVAPYLEAAQAGYYKQTGRRVQQGSVIRQISGNGTVITQPGTYTLDGDITWSPSSGQTAAITIQSSNVTLDLGGHTLTASVPATTMATTGIMIANGELENITVQNGTIAAFTEYGVQANAICGLTITGINVTGLSLTTSTALTTPAGIFVANSLNVAISNCNVSGSNVTSPSAAGIQLLTTNLATVSNCTVSSMVNNDGGMQGYGYLGCGSITTTNCSATGLQTHFISDVTTPGHTCIGFVPTFCQNLSFVNCSATNITGCCDDCHGMSVFVCAYVTVSGFKANGITDGVAASNAGAKATGLEVYSLTSVKISNCTVTNVLAINPEDLQAAGFAAWGPSIEFDTCSASNVSVQNDKKLPDVRGIGFGWAPDPRPNFSGTPAFAVLYSGCSATNCDVAFDTWDHMFSTWTNPTISGCKVGFLVEPGAQRTVSCDGCSECPGATGATPGPVTLTNMAVGNTYPT